MAHGQVTMMGGLFVVETSAGEERARVLKDVSLCLVIATSNGNAGAWAVGAFSARLHARARARSHCTRCSR